MKLAKSTQVVTYSPKIQRALILRRHETERQELECAQMAELLHFDHHDVVTQLLGSNVLDHRQLLAGAREATLADGSLILLAETWSLAVPVAMSKEVPDCSRVCGAIFPASRQEELISFIEDARPCPVQTLQKVFSPRFPFAESAKGGFLMRDNQYTNFLLARVGRGTGDDFLSRTITADRSTCLMHRDPGLDSDANWPKEITSSKCFTIA